MIGQRALWLGFAASAGFLAIFVVLFVDFSRIASELRSANYLYVAPSMLFYLASLYLRAHRWKFLLFPVMGSPRRPIFPVVVVGYMANNLIPMRMGEIVRSYYTSLREDISTSGALGTIAVERASDALALLFLLAIAWTVVPAYGAISGIAEQIPGGTATLILAGLMPFILVMAAVAAITAVSEAKALSIAARVASPLPHGARARVLDLLTGLLRGMTVVRSPRKLFYLIVLSLPIWLMEAAMYGTIAIGFDMPAQFNGNLEFVAVILVFTAAANLAGVLPSTAGGWGPFDLFGAAALVALGLSGNAASAYAITVHVALWVPPTLLGAALLLFDGASLTRLADDAKRSRLQPSTGPAGTKQAL